MVDLRNVGRWIWMVDREGIWGCRYVIEAFIQCTCRYGQE